MGGVELDLRGATAAPGGAVIDVFVMWGGIEIWVPPDWAVSNEVMVLMGGADDKSTGAQDARSRLTVRGFCVMGGIEIGPKP
jgi:predicted membrane protein